MKIELFPSLHFSLGNHDKKIFKLVWHEGLQLLPQHFQSLDARTDTLISYQMQYEQPLAWGIDTLYIDEAQLGKGKLVVQKISGRFEDGTFFVFDTDSVGQEISYTLNHSQTDSSPVRYAICVPKEDAVRNNTILQRYKQFVGKPIPDATNPAETAALTHYILNLSIHPFNDQESNLYFQIPFIEIVQTPAGYEAVDFHPPAPRLLRDSLLMRELLKFVGLIRTKAQELGALPLASSISTDFRVGREWIFVSLLKFIPRLEMHLQSQDTSPYTILTDLCDIAGTVIPLTKGALPEKFPAYDHFDPAASIRFFLRLLTESISQIGVSQSRISMLPFEANGDEWRINIPREFSGNDLWIKVRFSTGKTESFIASWLGYALICFEEEKNRCRELRIKGLSRQGSTHIPHLGLDAESGVRYISIDPGLGNDNPGLASNIIGKNLIISGLSHEHRSQVLSEVSLIIINRNGSS